MEKLVQQVRRQFNSLFVSQKAHSHKRKQKHGIVPGYINEWYSQKKYGQQLDYENCAKEGYMQNVIVYRCVSVIARALSSVPLLLYQHERYHQNALFNVEHELDHHPLLDVLHKPGQKLAGANLIENVISHVLLSGNGFIEAVVNGEGVPVGLNLHRPDRVKVQPDGYWVMRDHFEGSVKNALPHMLRFVPCDPITQESLMLHLKLFHPLDEMYGLSPLSAAAKAIDQHNAVAGHNLALLENGGRPSGALLYKNADHGMGLSEGQRQNLRTDLKNAIEGQSNAGRVMILEGDFAWQEMGLSPKDLDFAEGKHISAREICQVFGVPPMLAGVPGDATFANYKEARFHLWEDTILPLLDTLIAELNRWLVPYYGSNLRIGYDLDRIQALAPKREMAWAKVEGVSFLTINEKRQAVGYGPIEGGDILEK